VNAVRIQKAVAAVTLVAGGALAVAPRIGSGPMGLGDEHHGVRAAGIADLVLLLALVTGGSRSSWMFGRSALSLAQASYLDAVAPRSNRPGVVRAGAGAMLALSIMDAATAVELRRRHRWPRQSGP
jgi:hypothetical protein